MLSFQLNNINSIFALFFIKVCFYPEVRPKSFFSPLKTLAITFLNVKKGAVSANKIIKDLRFYNGLQSSAFSDVGEGCASPSRALHHRERPADPNPQSQESRAQSFFQTTD